MLDILRESWSGLLAWAAPPIRLAIAVAIVALLVARLGPPAVRALGRFLAGGAVPLAGVLTLPEYVATSVSRRMTGRPALGAYAYGQALGTSAAAVTVLGRSLAKATPHHLRYPKKTVIAVGALLVLCWYTGLTTSSGSGFANRLNTRLAGMDTWMTGSPTVAPFPPPAPCNPTPPPRKR